MAKRTYRDFAADEGSMKRRTNTSEISQDQRLISLMTKLGGQSPQLEGNINKLSEVLREEYANFREIILKTICQVVTEQPEKVSVYSTLVGLLNATNGKIGEEVLDQLHVEMKDAIVGQHYERVRFLVRFLADLVNTRVADVFSINEVFGSLMSVRLEADVPQLRSDWFVYCVLSALPWVGGELNERSSEQLQTILSEAEDYVSQRDKAFLPALEVFMSDDFEQDEDYLEFLVRQLKSLAKAGWKENVLVRPYNQFSRFLYDARPHKFPELIIPDHVDSSLYPIPKVPLRIFTEEEEAGTIPLPTSYSSERFLMEDLISSICLTYGHNRKDTVLCLVQHVDRLSAFAAPHATVEVLMGLILQLPTAPNLPIFYGSVLSGLCKQKPTVFPVILNKAVNRLFMKLTTMHPIAINRFALWFGHHLSNWKYEWKWEDWTMALQLAQDSPKVRFIREVLAKCLRLSYFDRMVEIIPESFHPLLPPQPASNFKYTDKADVPAAEMAISAKMTDAVTSKASMGDIVAILDSLHLQAPELQAADLEVKKVEIAVHTLLQYGDKSITHCFQTLFKHRQLLLEIVRSTPSKIMCVQAVAEFFENKSQWMQLVLNKLLRMGVVDPVDIIEFVFLPEVVGALTRGFLWEMVDATINISVGIFTKASQELKKCEVELVRYSDIEVLTVDDAEKKADLESEVKLHQAKMENADDSLKETIVLLTQKILEALNRHCRLCTERQQSPQNQWFTCTLAGLQQVLIQNRSMVVRYSAELESEVFVDHLQPSFLDVYKRYQSLL